MVNVLFCPRKVIALAPVALLLACSGASRPDALPGQHGAAKPDACPQATALRKTIAELMAKGKLARAQSVSERLATACEKPDPVALAGDLTMQAEIAIDLGEDAKARAFADKVVGSPDATVQHKTRARAVIATAEKRSRAPASPRMMPAETLALIKRANAVLDKGDEASLRAARDMFVSAYDAVPTAEAALGAGVAARALGDDPASSRYFDRAFTLLTTETERPHAAMATSQLAIQWIAWSKNGQLIVNREDFAANAREVQIFDAATGRERRHYFYPYRETNVTLSGDGERLGVQIGAQYVELLDIATSALIHEYDIPGLGQRIALFTPDLSRIVAIPKFSAAKTDPFSLFHLDPASANDLQIPQIKAQQVDARISPDGSAVAIVRDDKLLLADIEKNRVRTTFPDHESSIEGVVFSSDGKRLATSVSRSESGIVRIFDIGGGPANNEIKISGLARNFAFSPDGSVIAMNYSGHVSFWDSEKGTHLRTMGSEFQWGAFAFSPDAQRLAVACNSDKSELCIASAETGSVQRTLDRDFPKSHTLAISPDGNVLFLRTLDGMVRVIDLATGALKPPPISVPRQTTDEARMALSRNGKLLATDAPGRVVIVDVQTGARVFDRKVSSPFEFALSAAGDIVAVSASFAILLHAVDSKDAPRKLTGHSGSIYSLAFSPDGKVLASGSSDKTVRLWDIATGTLKHTLKTDGTVSVLAFSPDGKKLASSSVLSGITFLWDVETGVQKRAFPDPQQSSRKYSVGALTFSPDGKQLLIGRRIEDLLQIWDIDSGNMVSLPPGYGQARAAVFAPNGSFIVTSWEDGSIRFQRPVADSPSVTVRFAANEDAALVVDDKGRADLLGKNPCVARARLYCQIGNVGWPFDVCEDNVLTNGLLAKVLSGAPIDDDPTHVPNAPRCVTSIARSP